MLSLAINRLSLAGSAMGVTGAGGFMTGFSGAVAGVGGMELGAMGTLGSTATAVIVPGAEPRAVGAAAPPVRAPLGEVALVRAGSRVAPVIKPAVFRLAAVPLCVVPAAASTVAIVLIPTSASRRTAHAGSLAAGLAAITSG